MAQSPGNNSPGYPLPSRSRPPRRAEPKKSGAWPGAQRGNSTWEGLEPSPTGPPGNTNTTPCWVSPPKGAPMATSARHTTHTRQQAQIQESKSLPPKPRAQDCIFPSGHPQYSNSVKASRPTHRREVQGVWVAQPLSFYIPSAPDSSSALCTYRCSHLGPGPPAGSRSFQTGRTHHGP